MKRCLPTIVCLAAMVAGCGSNPAVQDVVGTDVIGTDVPASDEGPDAEVPVDANVTCGDNEQGCVGGCAAMTVEGLQAGGGQWDCANSPGVSGRPVPVPVGGWLIQSYPDPCCTDIEARRLTWLKTDGTASVLLETQRSAMAPTETLPALLAVLADGFVLTRSTCVENYDCWTTSPGSLTALDARHYDGTAWWSLTAEALDGTTDVTLLDTDGDEMWLFLGRYPDATTYEKGIVRINADGTIAGTWPLTVPGKLAGFAADDDGFLLVLTESSQDADTKSIAIRTVHVGRDGIESALDVLYDVDSFNVESSIFTGYYTTGKGIIVSLSIWADGEGEDISRTWYMDVDGSRRWYRPDRWDEYPAFNPGLFHEFADGSIGYMNSEKTRYIVLSADGSQMTNITNATDSPIDGATGWRIIDWLVSDDGILVTGDLTLDTGHKAAVAAMYEPEFAALKWVRKYAEDCDAPGLVQDADGLMFWCQGSVDWAECSSLATPSGTYLHFDSVCQD